jgi:hypothetical protein
VIDCAEAIFVFFVTAHEIEFGAFLTLRLVAIMKERKP